MDLPGGTAPTRRYQGPDMAEDDLKITVSPQQFSIDVMLEKYAKGDETSIEDIYRRVARGVAMAEPTL